MWNSLSCSCLLCAVCKSVFTDCRDISTIYYINHLDMVTITTIKSCSPMWNSLDLSCLLCAVCKSVFTDCRDISTLYYINHIDMVTTTTTKSWSPMWNSLDLSCLLCTVCKSVLYWLQRYINTLLHRPLWHGYDQSQGHRFVRQLEEVIIGDLRGLPLTVHSDQQGIEAGWVWMWSTSYWPLPRQQDWQGSLAHWGTSKRFHLTLNVHCVARGRRPNFRTH